jgi:uncharacterized protein with NRDE domain
MSLAVVALDAHPRYAVVLVANRDEFHARAAAPAHWWEDGTGAPILAGRDLAHGGTWLALAPDGRYGFVTNVRDPGRHDPQAPSRGALVPALVRDARPIADALGALVEDAQRYNGFNLVGGQGLHGVFGSNRGAQTHALGRGIHGVSNARLDTPWPKLLRAKHGVIVDRTRRRDSAAALRRARRPNAGRRRAVAEDRHPARARTPALVAVHRERHLRHALVHHHCDRSRRNGAVPGTDVRSRRRAHRRCRVSLPPRADTRHAHLVIRARSLRACFPRPTLTGASLANAHENRFPGAASAAPARAKRGAATNRRRRAGS